MLFLYLFLGHLIADFVLQTDKIIVWKNKSWKGVLFHSAIHFFVYATMFLLLQWNIYIIMTLSVVCALHFAVDGQKIIWEKKNHYYLKSFFIDQVAHIVILGLASFFISRFSLIGVNIAENIITNRYLVVYMILAIILSYCVEVVRFKFELEKQQNLRFKPDFWAIFKRLFVFSLGYGVFMIMSHYEVAKTLLF